MMEREGGWSFFAILCHGARQHQNRIYKTDMIRGGTYVAGHGSLCLHVALIHFVWPGLLHLVNALLAAVLDEAKAPRPGRVQGGSL